MNHRLTPTEALFLVQALNGTDLESFVVAPAQLLLGSVSDAVALCTEAEPAPTHHRRLLARLASYTDDDARDLLDRVRRFWDDPNPTDDALARAGLA